VQLTITNARELVSMAVRHDLVAVGGLSLVCLLDPRKRDPAVVDEIESPDQSAGIRSLCISNDLVSFGTGKGKIAFFDLRASKFLSIDTEPGEEISPRPSTPGSTVHQAGQRGAGSGEDSLVVRLQSRPEAARDTSLLFRLMRHEFYEDEEQQLDVFPPPKPGYYLQTGPGWVQENATYLSYFGGRRIHHACYAHAWDPSGARLFTCGGPLAFGLSGGHMALWE
jgi:WD repeat-containing protein 40A